MMNDRTYFVCSTISRVSLCIDVEDTCNLRMSSPLAGRFRDVCGGFCNLCCRFRLGIISLELRV